MKTGSRSGLPLLTVVFLVSTLLYATLCFWVPVALFPASIHDDGFYIERARDIANGLWLGRYSQYTLMKGPGYPLFLAAVSLAGIPVTIAQALLFSASVYLLSLVTLSLFRSVWFSIVVFQILLWNFGPETGRIMREGIYHSQFLIAFSLLLLALFHTGRLRLLMAAASGLCLGWMWITREEGIVVLPAFLLVFAYFAWTGYRQKRDLGTLALAGMLFAASLAVCPSLVAWLNFRAYQTFSTVDVKGEFQGALEALASIQASDKIPFVPISKQVREAAYRVSPTFARLHYLFDDPGSPAVAPWKVHSCGAYPKACGDYVLGWFMWALRDAAFIDGDYVNAHASSSFYGQIRDEVKHACASGALVCVSSQLPYVPRLKAEQLRRMPRSLWSLLRKLTFVDQPDVMVGASFGTVRHVVDVARFLHVKNYSVPNEVAPAPRPVGAPWLAICAKAVIIRLYAWLLPVLLGAGGAAFVICIVKSIRKRTCSAAMAIVLIAWVTVAIRLGLLAVIDVTAFPASYHQYISLAFPLSCFAALLSIYILTKRSSPEAGS